MKQKEYGGILAEPLPRRGIDGPSGNEYDALHDAKIVALFKHFGIIPVPGVCAGKGSSITDSWRRLHAESTAWMELALRLAHQHVPGFRTPPSPPRKPGRPRERDQDDITLLLVVELLKRRDHLSIKAATKKIADAEIIKGAPETLRFRYNNRTVINSHGENSLVPALELFQQLALRIGEDAFIKCLEDALGDVLRDRL